MRAICLNALVVVSLLVAGDSPRAHTPAQREFQGPADHDGQHDFDFLIGSWKLHLKRLTKPLSGSTDWEELDGTVVCRKVWDGKANLEEVVLDGVTSRAHIEG